MGQWDDTEPDSFDPKEGQAPGQGGAPFTQPGSELNATLRGYDADAELTQAPAAGPGLVKETRLCQGCGVVGPFVGGRCQNCGFMPVRRDHSPEEVAAAASPAFDYQAPGDSGMLSKIVVGVLAAGLLAAVGFYVLPMLRQDEPEATPEPAPREIGAAADTTHAGALNQVVIDDAFHQQLTAQLQAGNSAWEKAGLKAYVYRYGIVESLVPATSQDLTINLEVGGADRVKAAASPEPFMTALKAWQDGLDARDGVTLRLHLSTDKVNPAADERYVRYGREWGEEHKAAIDEVIRSIEAFHKENGQYPLELSSDISSAKTNGNPTFSASGFGYLPLFKVNAGGEVEMGSGSGLSSYLPAEISGYMLFVYLRLPGEGLDVYSPADIKYYTDNISPFPYKPGHPVRNMPLTPDGKPDGVACVVKNGAIL